MQKLNFNLSASALNIFCKCPFAFKCEKIDKILIEKIPSSALVSGQAFHKLLLYFYKTKIFNTYSLFENWEKFFNIETKIQNAQNLELKFAKATGYTMIKNWVTMAKKECWLHSAYLFNDGEEGIELKFYLPYDNNEFEINVSGAIDLIIEVNGKINILDWKTGKLDDKHKMQGIIYSWALYKKYGLIEDVVRFVHPAKKENKIVDVKVEEKDYYLIVEKVNEIFKAIQENNFKKINGEHCKWCGITKCQYKTVVKI